MTEFHDIPNFSIGVTQLELRVRLYNPDENGDRDTFFSGKFVVYGNNNYWPKERLTALNIFGPPQDLIDNFKNPYSSSFYNYPIVDGARPDGAMQISTSLPNYELRRLAHMYETKSIKTLIMEYKVLVPTSKDLDLSKPFSWMELASEEEAVGLKLLEITVAAPEYLLKA